MAMRSAENLNLPREEAGASELEEEILEVGQF